MGAQLQQMQHALASKQTEIAKPKNKLARGSEDSGGLIRAICKDRLKESTPRKFRNVQTSGAFHPWARAMK